MDQGSCLSTGKLQQANKCIECGGVCMLILHVVTRLAELGDMSAQLQGDSSASSRLLSTIYTIHLRVRRHIKKRQRPRTLHPRPTTFVTRDLASLMTR